MLGLVFWIVVTLFVAKIFLWNDSEENDQLKTKAIGWAKYALKGVTFAFNSINDKVNKK